MAGTARVGLVADTHGLVEPRLERLFAGCDLVLHAGDVGKEEVLASLRAIAPVWAVRGNVDELGPLEGLPEVLRVDLGGLTALLVHDLGPRDRPHPPAARAIARVRPQIVVHGHSHRPGHALLDGVLFVNPGSAGPRRFSLPRTAGILVVEGRSIRLDLLDLAGPEPLPFGETLRAAL
jgi:uncharacterized protein